MNMKEPTEEELEELEKETKRKANNKRFVRGSHALHDQVNNDPELDPENFEVIEALESIGDMIRKSNEVEQGIDLQEEVERVEEIHSNDPSPMDEASFALMYEKIEGALDTLTERERNVLSLRFGLKANYATTLEEIGRQFKVTRERIRKIEAKALKKMKRPERIRQLDKFFEEPSSVNKPKPEALRQLGL